MKNRKKLFVSGILVLAVLFSATALTLSQTDLLSSNEQFSDKAQTETLSYLEKSGDTYAELKCGEGKCGEGAAKDSTSKETKCGDGKCGDGKSAEEADTKESKSEESKCGEGKCGK